MYCFTCLIIISRLSNAVAPSAAMLSSPLRLVLLDAGQTRNIWKRDDFDRGTKSDSLQKASYMCIRFAWQTVLTTSGISIFSPLLSVISFVPKELTCQKCRKVYEYIKHM